MESNEKYRVCCIVDNTQPEIKAMQEKDMKKRLLCELEEVLCSGDAVTIKVTREESPDIYGFCNVGASHVTYTANLGLAQEMPIMINAEPFRKYYIQAMRKMIERATKQEVQHQEQKIIQDYTAAGQITPQGINTAIKKLQAAATMSRQRQQALVIANAATAAAIRKQFSREEVEVIISQAVETTTAYVVTDETLKQQLLQSIDKRGY